MVKRLFVIFLVGVSLVLVFSLIGCYSGQIQEEDSAVSYMGVSNIDRNNHIKLEAGSGTGKPWFFNLHPEDINYDIVQADAAFDRIIELGGRGVRTDVCWYDVEPSRDVYDASMVSFYKEFFAHAVAKGLSCMAILGGWGRTPDWAQSLYDSDPQAFCDEFLEFCQYVASQVGDNVVYYQIWNEANHPSDGIDSANDWVVMWYGGKGVKNADPTSIRFVNVFCNVTGWTDTVESWFNNLANYETVIDGLGIDHYPGTWAAGDGSDWYPLDWLFDFMDRYGKKGAICETGYSSWAWLQADEYDQENWVHTALPIISSKIAGYAGKDNFLFCNFYELQDANTDGGPNPEYHFGIYHTDWTKKLAWDDLQSEISTF
ncbi:MAG: hypothetical protein J7L52_07380 [Thermotogae bacterium]|nr:hypothetical protein [Thermotogota bacterium]